MRFHLLIVTNRSIFLWGYSFRYVFEDGIDFIKESVMDGVQVERHKTFFSLDSYICCGCYLLNAVLILDMYSCSMKMHWMARLLKMLLQNLHSKRFKYDVFNNFRLANFSIAYVGFVALLAFV